MKKVLSCIFSFLPLVFVLTAGALKLTFSYIDIIYEDSAVYKTAIMILLLVIAGITALVDTIVFVVKAMKNKRIESDMRVIWAACIVLFGMFAYPVYWIVYLRTEQKSDN